MTRNSIRAFPNDLLPDELPANNHGNNAAAHIQAFADSIRSRQPASSPIDDAVRSDVISHLCDIAVRTGERITWDPIASRRSPAEVIWLDRCSAVPRAVPGRCDGGSSPDRDFDPISSSTTCKIATRGVIRMKIGVFLLIEPFASVETQLQRAKEMGFDCADITDTNAGGSMLGTAGFSPTVSLDDNPFDVQRLFEKYGITPSTVCAMQPYWNRVTRASTRPPRS